MIDEALVGELPPEEHDEHGFVLVWMLLIIGVLIAVAALSVDLVHAYSVAQRAQNAADAAAMAGAIAIPTDTNGDNAKAKSCEMLVNHYDYDCSTEVPVNNVASDFGGPANEMRVKVTKRIDTFFARYLGFPTVDVSREAHAQYDAPVQMGSAANFFGGVPECPNINPLATMPNPAPRPSCQNVSGSPHLWAQVQGPLYPKRGGNAITTTDCSGALPVDGCPGGINDDHDPNGEYFYIRNDSGGPLEIWIYDPSFVATTPACGVWPDLQVGDWNNSLGPGPTPPATRQHIFDSYSDLNYCSGDTIPSAADTPMSTSYQLYAPDSVPDRDPTNNPVEASCNGGAPSTFPGFAWSPHNPAPVPAGKNGPNAALAYETLTGNPTYFHQWYKLCTIAGSPTIDGNEYILRVQGSGGSGSNAFSVMATHGGLQSQRLGVFTRDKMPLFAADYSGSGSSTFYLARVLPSTQDRTLVVDFFDLGDNSCPSPPCNNRGQLKLTTSSDVTATFSCSWTEPPPNGSPSRSLPLSEALYNKNTCTLDYDADHASNTWDARWVSLKIKIEAQGDPGGYNCTTTGPGAYQNCWIKLIVDPTAAGANISDATTWGARMAGSPVRLVK